MCRVSTLFTIARAWARRFAVHRTDVVDRDFAADECRHEHAPKGIVQVSAGFGCTWSRRHHRYRDTEQRRALNFGRQSAPNPAEGEERQHRHQMPRSEARAALPPGVTRDENHVVDADPTLSQSSRRAIGIDQRDLLQRAAPAGLLWRRSTANAPTNPRPLAVGSANTAIDRGSARSKLDRACELRKSDSEHTAIEHAPRANRIGEIAVTDPQRASESDAQVDAEQECRAERACAERE